MDKVEATKRKIIKADYLSLELFVSKISFIKYGNDSQLPYAFSVLLRSASFDGSRSYFVTDNDKIIAVKIYAKSSARCGFDKIICDSNDLKLEPQGGFNGDCPWKEVIKYNNHIKRHPRKMLNDLIGGDEISQSPYCTYKKWFGHHLKELKNVARIFKYVDMNVTYRWPYESSFEKEALFYYISLCKKEAIDAQCDFIIKNINVMTSPFLADSISSLLSFAGKRKLMKWMRVFLRSDNEFAHRLAIDVAKRNKNILDKDEFDALLSKTKLAYYDRRLIKSDKRGAASKN